jgi:hypothetical protein
MAFGKKHHYSLYRKNKSFFKITNLTKLCNYKLINSRVVQKMGQLLMAGAI